MEEGYLKEVGNYGNPTSQFAPSNEPPFPVKGAASQRRNITLYRCSVCGFLEMYAP
jgi:hypothetical protein